MDKEFFDYILNQIKTHPAFPKIYDGFREIEELEKAEDSMLELIKDIVKRVEYDKVVETFSLEKIAEFERNLGLSQAGTKDERKDRLVEFLQRSGVINDDVLYRIAVEAAGTDDIDMISRPESYSLAITTKANTVDEDLDQDGLPDNLQKARDAVMPVAPQNLKITVGVQAQNSRDVVATYGMRATLLSYIGLAKPYEPYHTSFAYIGLMDANGSYDLYSDDLIGFIDRPGSAPVSTKEMIGIDEYDKIGLMNISEGVELILYSRSGPYQTLNQNLAAGANAHVYDEGAPTTRDGDETKAYTIKEVFNAAGVSLDATNLTLFVTSGKLKIQNNGSATVAWNKLTCTEGMPNTIDVIATGRFNGNGMPNNVAFANNNDYWWVFLSKETNSDVVSVVSKICGTKPMEGGGWAVLWSSNATYSVLGFYSDDNATAPIQEIDEDDAYIAQSTQTGTEERSVIRTRNANPQVEFRTYRLRITQK